MNPYQTNFKSKRKPAPKEVFAPSSPMLDPTDKIAKQLFGNEISVSESDVYRALSPYGQNNDSVVRSKGLKIYREMCEDDQIKACLEIRKQALLASKWHIDSANESSIAKQYKEYIEHTFERIEGSIERTLYEIYSAMEYGFSITEIVLKVLEDGPFAGKLGIRCLKTREPYNYDFKTDAFGNNLGLVYTGLHAKVGTESSLMMPGTIPYPTLKTSTVNPLGTDYGTLANPLPAEKFIIYSYNAQFGNPYGRSDLLACFRHWVYKKFVMRFWTIWLERYAAPFVTATYDQGLGLRRELMDEIDDFITNLSARTGIRVPKGVAIEISKTDRATGDIYELAVEAYNRYMSHALLCPNLLGFTGNQGGGGGASGGGGSYALGKQQANSFLWTVEKMSEDTAEIIMRDQLIERLIVLNFPNANPEDFPKFSYDSFNEDATIKRVSIIKTLGDGGFVDVNEEWIREFLMLPEKDPSIVLEKPNQFPGFGGPQDEEEPGKKFPNKKPDAKKQNKANKKKKKFAEKRAPNAFEAKLNVQEFTQKIESLEDKFFDSLIPDLEDLRDNLIRYVEKKQIIQNADSKAVNSIPLNVGALKESLRMWLVKIFLDSKLGALEELGRAGVAVQVTKKFSEFADGSLENWTPLPPSEAMDFFNRKVNAKIVNRNGKKILLTLAQKKELDYYDAKAFAISGVVRDDILNSAKQVLLNAITRNDVPGGISDLKDIFNKYTDSGIMEDGELLEPSRLSTIVRTNMMESINQGRKKMYEDPDVTGFVPFFEYSSILDDRTTDYCRCMDQKNFRLEDMPILSPPAHYNCRSITVPITQLEVDELKDEGKGVALSNPCEDRARAFTDSKRDPLDVNEPADGVPLPVEVEPVADAPDLTPEPPAEEVEVEPKVEETVEPEPEPVEEVQPVKTDTNKDIDGPGLRPSDVESTRKLREELRQIITMCPYSGCHSTKIKFKRKIMNVGEYHCEACELPFRVSNRGDMYFYDAGTDVWMRTTQNNLPLFFKDHNKRK